MKPLGGRLGGAGSHSALNQYQVIKGGESDAYVRAREDVKHMKQQLKNVQSQYSSTLDNARVARQSPKDDRNSLRSIKNNHSIKARNRYDFF